VDAAAEKQLHAMIKYEQKTSAVYALNRIPPSVTWGSKANANYISQADTNKRIMVWTVGRISHKWFASSASLVTLNIKPLDPEDLNVGGCLFSRYVTPPLIHRDADLIRNSPALCLCFYEDVFEDSVNSTTL